MAWEHHKPVCPSMRVPCAGTFATRTRLSDQQAQAERARRVLLSGLRFGNRRPHVSAACPDAVDERQTAHRPDAAKNDRRGRGRHPSAVGEGARRGGYRKTCGRARDGDAVDARAPLQSGDHEQAAAEAGMAGLLLQLMYGMRRAEGQLASRSVQQRTPRIS